MAMTGERRDFGRRTSRIHSWICVRGRPRIPCMMMNVTATGAFLHCIPPSWLPYRFEVGIGSETNLRFCELRRIGLTGVGITFLDAGERTASDRWNTAVVDSDHWTGMRPPVHLTSAVR